MYLNLKNMTSFYIHQVQTGFGRTGSHFWGFQGHEVMPDIVTMAKGIAGGFPMGALVTTPGETAPQQPASLQKNGDETSPLFII